VSARIITWQRGTEPLGSAVVAIGVFDGVHRGHQAVLRDTVADAGSRGAHSVAVTFDRDPDQVVSPQTAAPQLLTLGDKLSAMARTGVDAILVIPFTHELAEMEPESFLEDVLLSALAPVAVHVGHDFRFGRRAAGDVATLKRVGAEAGFEVVPHALVTAGGQPVTSTRIRGLVAAGDIAQATELLGGHPCVTGTVHPGRGEGAGLGYPTANVVSVPFAALPGDGVYAGRALLADGSLWPAAISVGVPPMFPQAADYLEAYLLDFDGDLYGRPITLEFWARLRDHETYSSLHELKTAIAEDVRNTAEIAGFTDIDDIADPAALEAAERAVRAVGRPPKTATTRAPSRPGAEERVVLLGDLPFDKQHLEAIDAALFAAEIDHFWEPYAPDQRPLLHLNLFGMERFSVSVARSDIGAARIALGDLLGRTEGE
jgi:riboflavin kinase / FMN adenylyltransferase